MRRLVPLALSFCALAGAGAALAGSERTALSFRPFLTGVDQPVYVASTPSEPRNLYVVEQPGRIRVAVGGRLRATPFLDIRPEVVCCGEQGLLSVAFHPQYQRNRLFYVNFTDRSGDTRVVQYRSNGTRAVPGSRRQLLFVDQPYSNHNGGQLQFGPDGMLYVGMGDGGSGGDPHDHGQNLDSRLGKLLRIDVGGGRVSTAAYGLRNPWRFSFDRANGDLYLADVGQNTWEEINWLPFARLRSVPNFGWAVYEGNARFKDQPLAGPGPLVKPVATYDRAGGCSVSGGYVYRGPAVPAMRGRYVYGDFCTGKIWSLRMAGGRAAVREESTRIENLSSFGEDVAGELYATSLGGTVYRIGG